MPVPLIISALWLLCMFCAVTHAAQRLQRMDVVALLVAAALTLVLTRWLSPQAGWVGLLVSVSAAWALLRQLKMRTAAILAGIHGALAAVLYSEQGLPLGWATLLCVALTLSSAYLAHRVTEFASTSIRQQALLGLAWSAPCVAATPSVLSGWQSAQALNRTVETANHTLPGWTWQFVVCALVLGLVHGLWVHKK